MNNNLIQPLLATQASSCLTNNDLQFAEVTTVSLDLKNLLLRPGKDYLQAESKTCSNLRSFVAWDDNLVLNCSSINFTQEKFHLVSEVDGSKFTYSIDEILDLINIIDVDMVVYPLVPPNKIETFPVSNNCFLDVSNYQVGFGVYFKSDDSINNILNFVNSYQGATKYLIGSFGLDTMLQIRNYSDLYIENHKPSLDGYNGIIYRNMNEQSILDDSLEFEFVVLDKNCKCYTCSSGYTSSYLHHLYKNTPLLAQRLLILHNVFYISHLP